MEADRDDFKYMCTVRKDVNCVHLLNHCYDSYCQDKNSFTKI